jgi:hypothetical protein
MHSALAMMRRCLSSVAAVRETAPMGRNISDEKSIFLIFSLLNEEILL